MILRVEGARAGYGGTDVLHGVSLEVGPGEAVGVLGANGAGKTTLMRVVSGQLALRQGSLEVAGSTLRRARTSVMVRKGIVLVAEGHEVIGSLSVLENLRLGAFRFWPWLSYYSLPIAVLAVGNGTIGEFVRFISLEVQNVNGAMFIKAARARGSRLWRHFFRSMVLPIFNIVVANMAVLLGGIVVVERIFNFHGLGWLSWEATLKRDFPVIMGITLVMAFLIRLFMLANDLLAVWLDPRMRE